MMPAMVCLFQHFGQSLGAGFVLLLAVGSAGAQESCHLESLGTATVVAVRDGGTELLGDGRELRLAAVEIPPGAAAVSALQTLTGHQALTLKKLGASEDRYGRIVAFAVLTDGRSVQEALLAQGLARVGARAGGRDCAGDLLKSEQMARNGHLGLWADPNFAPLAAENPGAITARRGQFALVEGKVLSVRDSGSTVYVNFGRRWTRDFTVTILRRNQRMFVAAGVEPKKLEAKRIRVRGWIEQRRGPIIEAAHPEQIEIVDQGHD
jgi:endonuclease YncB( thermonuclease family)